MRLFLLSTIVAFVLLSACEPTVIFSDAQPKGIKTSVTFDEQYQGTYFCESDSSWVKIEPRLIYKEKNFLLVTTREEMEHDLHFHIDGDNAYIEVLDTSIELKDTEQKDQVTSEVTLRDTFFDLNKNGVLKSFKGHQIINTKFPSGHWQVEILTLDKQGNISYKRTKDPIDLKALEAVTDVELLGKESLPQYQLSPTRTEFKELLKTELVFEECDFFYRILDKGIM